MTRRHRILNELMTRLQGITPANGYATDAGTRFLYGAVEGLGKDDVKDGPLLNMVPGNLARLEDTSARLLVQLPISIRGMSKVDPEDQLAALEPLLGDIEKAIFGVDDKLAGEAHDVEYVTDLVVDRIEGGEVGVVGLDLLVKWFKTVGSPDA